MESDTQFYRPRVSQFAPLVVLAGGLLTGISGTTNTAKAQEFTSIQRPKTPLVLKAQGSFFVGGETVGQSRVELGSFGPAGRISINQMYVRFMIPQEGDNVPVVMIHGMALTGKTWETTPDGRMGWDEYFVRQGHPVYVPDQIARGRSGFNQSVFNQVRAGVTPPGEQPPMWRFSDENVWPNFRFGPQKDTPYPDAQFPVADANEFGKQAVPDLSMVLPRPNPNHKALSDLALQLGGAVLISHSQSGSYPMDAALLNAKGIRGMILVEPGGVPAYTDEQMETLAKLPLLVVFGDHLGDTPTGIPGHSWQTAFDGYQALVARLNAAGGKARMLHLPASGIRGNSHMPMQDKNNLQIADLTRKWMNEHVAKKRD